MNNILFLNLRPIMAEGIAALQAAKNLGYDVILMSNKNPEYARDYIKLYVEIDNKNEVSSIEQAKILAKNYNIKAVFSWNDTDIILAAKIAEALQLNHVSPKAALLAKNKFLCREHVYKTLPHLVPKFARVSINSDIEVITKDFTYPLIIKPVSASGSQAIYKVFEKTALAQALSEIEHKKNYEAAGLYNKFGDYYIIEEFLQGREISVEGFVTDELYIAGITDKTSTDPWYIEMRHIFPSNLNQHMQDKIKNEVRSLVKALNIHHAAIHVEMKIENEQCKLIEIATRTGGDLISTHLIAMALKINWLEFIIASTIKGALVADLIESEEITVAGVQFYIAKGEGTLKTSLVKSTSLMQEGARVVLPPQSFNQCRLGYILSNKKSYEEVECDLDISLEHMANEFMVQ